MALKIKYVDFWQGFDCKNNFLQQSITDAGYEINFSEEPDYLICGVFGHEFLNEKYDNCIKIFFTGENQCPDFNLYDYGIGFEYINFGDRYLRFPLFYSDEFLSAYSLMLNKHINARQLLNQKTDFCSFVYSNRRADPIREQFFEKLSEYKKVNSGGRYLNNIGNPDGVEDKMEFESKHKFSIAFENSSHPGYSTEKLIQAFAAGTVPIYWGDPRIKEVFNSESFIFVNDYESLDKVVDKIKEIDQNEDLYLKYLSTPAPLDSEKFDRENQKKQLEKFLRSIFDQDKEKAFRRNRGYWGKRYMEGIRNLWRIIDEQTFLEKFVRILRTEGFEGVLERIKR